MKKLYRRICVNTLFLALGILFSFSKTQAKPGDDYSPEKAIAYADSCFKKVNGSYQANPSKKYGRELCAGYVSQCLREGGMSEDSSWYWHGKGKTPYAWRVSTSLYSYLKKCGYQIISSPKASQVNAGDVIFYYTGSGWGHCAICVGKNSEGTPLINAYNNPHCHYSNWRLYYNKVCVVSMGSRTQTPEIEEAALESGKEITLSCATSDSTIYYTTNGKEPTKSSTVYKKPFTLKKSSQIKAFAVSKAKSKSKVNSSYINTEKVLSDGVYMILSSADNAKAVAIPSSSTAENASVKLAKKTENYNRKFSITYVEDGYYTITFLHSDKALTESSKTTASDSNGQTKTTYSICQKKLSSSRNQLWKLICTGKNTFALENAKTAHYLALNKALTIGEKVYPAEKDTDALLEFTITPTQKSEITLIDETLPTKIKCGNPFVIYGNLVSNYKLTSVEIQIKDKNKKEVVSVSAAPKKKKYDLFTLSPKIKFGKLSAGTYHFIVSAKDATGQTTTIINKTFKITK